jgi:hypothetical protein
LASSIAHLISGDPAHAVKGVHPLGQVMVVLSVPVPFQPLVGGIERPAFVQLLSDPKASDGRVHLALFLIEAADPAASRVVVSVTTEDAMDLINEPEAEISIDRIAVLAEELEVVADRKGVGPEVAARMGIGRLKSRNTGKVGHDLLNGQDGGFSVHEASTFNVLSSQI